MIKTYGEGTEDQQLTPRKEKVPFAYTFIVSSSQQLPKSFCLDLLLPSKLYKENSFEEILPKPLRKANIQVIKW